PHTPGKALRSRMTSSAPTKSPGLIDDPGVEIYVGIEFALDKELIIERDFLQFERDVELRIGARDLKDFVRDALDNPRAWIVVLVDPMPESHELYVARLHLFDISPNVALG